MPPLSLLIKPASSLCNMRCSYCFYHDVSHNRQTPCFGIMNEQILEKLIIRAFANADGYISFAFQGGEPTLAGLDFFQQVVALQKKHARKNVHVFNSIQTNGYILDKKWVSFFAENHFLVGLSLDGTQENHDELRKDTLGQGTYTKVYQAAELLTSYGIEFNVLCVVNELNARKPKKTYDALKKYRYLQFIPCLDPLDGKHHTYSLSASRYAEFLKQTFDLYYNDYMTGHYVSIRNFDNYVQMLCGRPPESCAMNGHCSCYCVVESDGSVYPCDYYVLDEWKLGNVMTDDFASMLASSKASLFVKQSLSIPEDCRKCPVYRLCRNGCRREREPLNKNGISHNRFCKAYRTFLEYSADKMMRMAQKMTYGA